MQIFDENFPKHKMRYISQCLLATFVIGHILMLIDVKSNAAAVASLGASTFIVFTMPEAQVSRPRFLIGGYFIGILIGTIFYFIMQHLLSYDLHIPHESLLAMVTAVAVGSAIFMMVILDFEHPPAAGVTLGLVANAWSLKVIIVIFIGILLLTGIKTILKPMLKNLL